MSTTTKQRCAHFVFRRYHDSNCTRRACMEENGKGWCKQHAPSTVKANREAWRVKFTEESKARAKAYFEQAARQARAAACVAALEGVADPAEFVRRVRALLNELASRPIDIGPPIREIDALLAMLPSTTNPTP